MKMTVGNSREMEKIGTQITSRLKGGDIVCLKGELGAGKTTLAKGIARSFKIKNNISSPTFALMNIYPVKSRKAGILAKSKLFNKVNDVRDTKIRKLIHIDTYRLKNEEELLDIGAEDYLGKPDTICIIEWPEKIKGLLKNKKCVKIRIKHSRNGRIIIC